MRSLPDPPDVVALIQNAGLGGGSRVEGIGTTPPPPPSQLALQVFTDILHRESFPERRPSG